jgi:hypothetical protein
MKSSWNRSQRVGLNRPQGDSHFSMGIQGHRKKSARALPLPLATVLWLVSPDTARVPVASIARGEP